MLEKMLKDYHAKGLMTKDKNMKVMKVASKHFHRMKEHDPEMCEELLREIHEIYCGPHYTKFFAVMDVKEMHHTDRNGHEVEGEHWTIEEAKMKMKEHKLPADVNEYDFYVAINANYHDKVKLFESWFGADKEKKVIEDAVNFYFHDEDAPEGKVFHYIGAMEDGFEDDEED